MTSRIDTRVTSQPPVFKSSEPAAPTKAVDAALKAADRAKRSAALQERTARWESIKTAGGMSQWVDAELKSRGLLQQHGDPAAMSDAERSNYKDAKKNEGTERRRLKALAWSAWKATHIDYLGEGVHWEESTDADALDLDDREGRAKSNGLPAVNTAEELAKALGVPLSTLRWLAFHRAVDTGTHYRRWSIPKRDGTLRTITSPRFQMMAAQRWILRNVAEKLPVHHAAHGFLSARSIVTNAAVHAGADVVVKVDIKDFFPTVTWRRVKGLLRKSGLSEQSATLMALIATEAPREVVQFREKTLYVASGPRALPQGAPTSPAITNAICLRMDRRMSGLARALGFRYTRYADDLAFSFRPSPEAVAQKLSPRAPVGLLLRGIGQITRAEGFRLNPKKTHVLRAGDRQYVTGLVVNRAPDGVPLARVSRTQRKALRAAIHNRVKGHEPKGAETVAQLEGMAAFVYMTDPARGAKLLAALAPLKT